jgi:hypothetical protein
VQVSRVRAKVSRDKDSRARELEVGEVGWIRGVEVVPEVTDVEEGVEEAPVPELVETGLRLKRHERG